MATESNSGAESAFSINTFYIIAVGVFLIWGIYGAVGAWYFSGTWSNKGQFGDMFGGLNSLFSGLAFAGVICAILMQKQELKLQREELENQRKEMKRFADAQEKSEKALNAQADILNITAKMNTINLFLGNHGTIRNEFITLRDSLIKYDQDSQGGFIEKEDQPNAERIQNIEELLEEHEDKKTLALAEITNFIGETLKSA